MLDNVLRGGFPLSFEGNDRVSTLHLYSRKHGDLERDYNEYNLSPTNYSQGNGNFRDVNQNRRPLVIKPASFRIKNRAALTRLLKQAVGVKQIKALRAVFKNNFTPGEVMSFIAESGLRLKMAADKFMGELLAISTKQQESDYGEGYWSDHWH